MIRLDPVWQNLYERGDDRFNNIPERSWPSVSVFQLTKKHRTPELQPHHRL